jgi:hypothetical protein
MNTDTPIRDIQVCHLPYQSGPFVVGTVDNPESGTGKSNVWLRTDGTWSPTDDVGDFTLELGSWVPPPPSPTAAEAMYMPEAYRYRGEGMVLPPTQTGDGYGLFFIRPAGGRLLKCIADDGHLTGWEHVSVSVVDQPTKCPSWLEMDAIKNLFWTEDAAVMQLHPPRADWVNNHAGCLHLWRPLAAAVPLPPAELVGLKELNPEEGQA